MRWGSLEFEFEFLPSVTSVNTSEPFLTAKLTCPASFPSCSMICHVPRRLLFRSSRSLVEARLRFVLPIEDMHVQLFQYETTYEVVLA